MLSHPLIFYTIAKGLIEGFVLIQIFMKPHHEGPQPGVRHVWDQLIKHALRARRSQIMSDKLNRKTIFNLIPGPIMREIVVRKLSRLDIHFSERWARAQIRRVTGSFSVSTSHRAQSSRTKSG